jgi:hypothetical protein
MTINPLICSEVERSDIPAYLQLLREGLTMTHKNMIFSAFPYFLAVLHGVGLTLIIVFWVNAEYENRLYELMVNRIIEPNMSNKEKALEILHKSHHLLKPRREFFRGPTQINTRDTLFRSSDIQLIDGGVCGSHTHVMGRLLQTAGFPIRVAQMKCGEIWGGHILLETKIDGQWAVLDALYNLSFEKADGTLASFKEVGQNWAYFQTQTPANYNPTYAYEDVRYTNWRKILILMPIMKSILSIVIGARAETFSLRAHALNVYKTYAILSGIGYCFLLALTGYIIYRKQAGRNQQPKLDVGKASDAR